MEGKRSSLWRDGPANVVSARRFWPTARAIEPTRLEVSTARMRGDTTICYLLSTICYLLSIIYYLLSTTYYYSARRCNCDIYYLLLSIGLQQRLARNTLGVICGCLVSDVAIQCKNGIETLKKAFFWVIIFSCLPIISILTR